MNHVLGAAIPRIIIQMLPELGEESAADVDDVAALRKEAAPENIERLRNLVSLRSGPLVLTSQQIGQVLDVIDDKGVPIEDRAVVATFVAADAEENEEPEVLLQELGYLAVVDAHAKLEAVEDEEGHCFRFT